MRLSENQGPHHPG